MKQVLHSSCRTLPIYSFYKISLYGDFKYLIKGYDEDFSGNEEVIGKTEKELIEALTSLVEEYAILTTNKKTIALKKMKYDLTFLTGRYNLIIKVLEIYKEYKKVEILELLTDLEVPFNKTKPIGEQIDSTIRIIKGLKNRINIATIKLKKLSGVNDDDDDDDKISPEEIISGLDKMALSLETNLELGYRVDIKTTPAERWANLIDMNNERMERQNLNS